MSKSNIAVKRPVTFTHEGAPASRISPEERLRRLVTACLLWEDSFYLDGEEIAEQIHKAAAACSPEFVRDLAVSVRKEHGIRHASLWLALSLLSRKAGSIAGDAIASVVSRADELAEVLAMYWQDGRKPLPAQLKRGLAKAFGRFDEYQLSKWNRDGAVKLRDVMFLCHPKPRDEAQAALFKRLAAKELAPADTWERALSTGGDKRAEFTRLLESGKMGYLACLRNLRNMLEAGVDRELIEARLLSDKGRQKILPFQFIAAAQQVPQMEGVIDAAMSGALAALPKLPGRTAVLIDHSGSMADTLSRRSKMNRSDAAIGLAIMAIAMSDQARCFVFSNACIEIPARANLGLRDAVIRSMPMHGTQLGAAVDFVSRQTQFDRMIVLTDEQTYDPVRAPSFIPLRYMVNLASYQNGVGYREWVHIDGFSDATLRFISEWEATASGPIGGSN